MPQKRLSSKFDAVIDKSSPASLLVEDACKLEAPTKRMKIDADAEVKNKIKSRNKPSSPARSKVALRRSLSTRPVSSKHAEDVSLTSIKEMHRFCEAAMETNAKQLSSRMSVADFVKLCDKTSLSKDFDVEAIQNSFGQFFAWATSSKSVLLGTALQVVMDYTADARSVVEHPSYPKEVPANYAYMLLCQKKGFSCFKAEPSGELKKQYQDETDPLTIQCREEANRRS
uniref:Uncharacterized protein n=1 Tax=Ditylenchus dipsaci TaxID=166011 RepID=A0A915DD66_9BILA